MDLSTQTFPFDEPLDEVLTYLSDLGMQGVDLSVDYHEYLDDEESQAVLLDLLDEHGLEISTLGAAGTNPLHPENERAAKAADRLEGTIRLAAQLGVDTVTSFSGLPGGADGDVTPHWVSAPVPGAQQDMYEYQWERCAIPFWAEYGRLADDYGVQIAIELHLNMLVSNAEELVRLREETSPSIGAYIDPGHLLLQGIDPEATIRYVAEHDALYHFEASDVKIYDSNFRLSGYTDMTPMAEKGDRSWVFCTVGSGHGEEFWRNLILTLDAVEYEGPVSIQQLHTPRPLRQGLETATEFLMPMLLPEP